MRRILFLILFFVIASGFIPMTSYGADEDQFIYSDLIIKDKKSWLTWTRDANIAGKEMTWDDASKFVKKLNEQKYAGLQCWRLPEKEEWVTLSDYIEKRQIGGFKNVQPNLYWSSTPYAGSDIWVVNMSLGSVSGASKAGLHYVWPVCDYDKEAKEREEKKKKEAILAAEQKEREKEQEQERLEAQRKKEAEQKRLAAQKIKDDIRRAQLAKAEEERKRVEKEKKKRQMIIAQRQKEKLDRLLPQCNNKILSHEDFLLGKNPYADKGKCVEFSAATFQMTSTNTGLFYIANNELAFIEFKETFRGSGVQGIAKIKGLYNYTTRSGISNQVPHLEMLKIEKILGR